jgi:hypothetical protein
MKQPKLKATKVPEYLVEPLREGYSRRWEGHHTTNPTVIRLKGDPRVFLGYRAGGDDDFHVRGPHEVWSSSLGLAVLDERGERVVHRFPLPIMRMQHDLELPRTQEAYQTFLQEHGADYISYHDFRFVEYRDCLHVLHHMSTIASCIDGVVRMPREVFLRKVEESIALQDRPVEAILPHWRRIWWEEGVWEPCGVDGAVDIWPSRVQKGDIVYFERPDGTLQLCHRPLPDIAVLDSGTNLHAAATPDGITQWGVLEQCIRPGFTDNSHIGNNGNPIRATIGDVEVYIDVTHGCHNEAVSNPDCDRMWVSYYPYLRVKDYETAEQLYYSEEPILDYEELWREYVEEGTWVRRNPVLKGVMFAGGQVETVAGRHGLDDEFSCYIGVGDTATARATFRLRDLLPKAVVEDIQVRKQHRAVALEEGIRPALYAFPKAISGWHWTLANDAERRVIRIVRRLAKNGYQESAAGVVNTRPGYFDADAVVFDGQSVAFEKDLGWLVLYKGVRWDERHGQKTSTVGFGVLVLDAENPQRVLYRSRESVTEPVVQAGWTAGRRVYPPAPVVEHLAALVPEKVRFEIRRMPELIERRLAFGSHMRDWLVKKAAFWDAHGYDGARVFALEVSHADSMPA